MNTLLNKQNCNAEMHQIAAFLHFIPVQNDKQNVLEQGRFSWNVA